MDNLVATLEAFSSDPFTAVVFVLAVALCVDMAFVRIGPSASKDAHLTPEERRQARALRKANKSTGDVLRGLDLRIIAQAVEDTIIDRQHLTRILGTGALDLWIDLTIEEREEGPTLRTRAKIAAFEPVALDEARIAQSARMIKRRVAEELAPLLGIEDAAPFVNGGVMIETAIERTA